MPAADTGAPPARGPYAGLADRAVSAVRGQQDAQRLLHALRGGCAPADLLHEALQQVAATGDAERLWAFARTLQKRIEGIA